MDLKYFPGWTIVTTCQPAYTIHYQTTSEHAQCGGITRSLSLFDLPCNVSTPAALLLLIVINCKLAVMCLLFSSYIHTKLAPQYLADCIQTVVKRSSWPGLRSANTAAFTKLNTRSKFNMGSESAISALLDLLPGTVSPITYIITLTTVFTSLQTLS